MGAADVVPGVSGGTIAFITGIYERLLNSIRSFDVTFFRLLTKGRISQAWKHVDGRFLFLLVSGMAAGLITGVFSIGILLVEYPAPVWAFFFGLILASAYYVGRQVKVWTLNRWTLLFLGTVIAYLITILNPGDGSDHFLFVLFSGIIAISALMLPGISGSFILLLLGMYTLVRSSVEKLITHFDGASLIVVGSFAVGCIIGLASFSRLLSFTFKRYHDQTMAVLCGFMLGSLNKIWPWRNVEILMNKVTGDKLTAKSKILEMITSEDMKIVKEVNVIPAEYYMDSPMLYTCIISFVVAFATVLVMTIADKKKSTL